MVTQPQQLVPTIYYDAHFLPHEAIHLVPTPSRANGNSERGGDGARLAKDKAQSGLCEDMHYMRVAHLICHTTQDHQTHSHTKYTYH